MQKRKFFTLFFALAAMMFASTGQIRADQVVYTYFDQGNNVRNQVTVNCGAVYNDYALLRYGGKNLTISVSAGYSITSIRFVVAKAVDREIISTTKGTLSNNRPQTDASAYVDDVNSTSVTLSTTEGEYRIERIEVNYKVEVPVGAIDGLTGKNGSFRVWGWTYDPDAEDSYAVTVHVYVFDNATETDLGKAKKGINAGSANISRPDLASLGHGTMHGFDFNLSLTDLNPGTYYVRVYALDKQGISNPALAYSGDVYVQAATIGSSYTVSYDANGGSGAPTAQKKAQDVTLTLQGKGSLTRTGYTTDGWATSATGNKAYNFGGNYTANAGATLYAHWNVVNYTIGYTLNGGSVSGNPANYNVETASFTLVNPTRAGYTFTGWTGSNGNTPQTTVTIAKGSTDNKTYTANWTIDTYTINYDLAGGAVASANPANYNVETANFTLINPTRANYTFLGWTGSNGDVPQTTVTIAKGSTDNKTYTANWTINPTTEVTYHMPDSIADEIVDLNRPEAPVIDGFTFVRWEFIGAPLSEGIKLQAIYKSNSNNAPKKVTKGEFTLEQKGDANEYILK